MSNICKQCEDPSWTGQDPIVAPDLPGGGGEGGTTDFNLLDNRPKYGGTKMTGNTNIPDVSNDISQLNTKVENVEDVIPEAASSNNQLADKNFVNSSVATNTANFIGTYNTIEELEAVQDPSNNDYGFVISVDSAGNTVYNRYKYSTSSGWMFEYALNNSSFTAVQWAAINSGATLALIEKLSGLSNIQSIGTGLALENGQLSAVGGGGGDSPVKELTTDDYYEGGNYVKLWELPDGLYYRNNSVAARISSVRALRDGQNFIEVFRESGSSQVKIRALFGNNLSMANGITEFGWVAHVSSGYESSFDGVLTTNVIQNNLTSDSTIGAVQPLSAYQGKVLKDLIDALDARITALGG